MEVALMYLMGSLWRTSRSTRGKLVWRSIGVLWFASSQAATLIMLLLAAVSRHQCQQVHQTSKLDRIDVAKRN
ncbi:hypothetical protein BKA63DRAFT_121261 [Paraphoma chrysanthemicola]|nr:hypothetical protein BKA63DRAFT_121261 [Paraphoma chrysanthemicola]